VVLARHWLAGPVDKCLRLEEQGWARRPEVIRCGHERRPRLRREPRCLYRVVGLSELHVFRSSMFLEVRVLVCLKELLCYAASSRTSALSLRI
jgi:hypothetical protein